MLFGLLVAVQAAELGTVVSPDGQIVLTCALHDGLATYRIDVAGNPILTDSPLGLELDGRNLSSKLTLLEAGVVTTVDEHYALVTGKRSQIVVTAHERVFQLGAADHGLITVRFRVANDGVAFRYELPLQPENRSQRVVTSEATGFALPAGSLGWLHPMHHPGGWANTQPSYEAAYSMAIAAGAPSPTHAGWCFPALFKIPGAGWALLSESGTDHGYCATRLGDDASGGVYRIGFPDARENRGVGASQPTISLPFASPWRLVQVGRTLAAIVNSTMSTDVVGPARVPFAHPLIPGRSAWSWVVQNDASCTYDNQHAFIDMAARLEWEYLLIDAGWDQRIGRARMRELATYAASKKVALTLWYNSNGAWNDAPQTPKGLMNESAARRAEMRWLQETGIAGIKIDFFGGDKQVTMQLYEDILRDAAEFGLAVNFHGTTLPRGWNRMYPNLMTAEAVAGMEMVSMKQGTAETQAVHATNLVFTRNVVAPMDYTPCTLQERLMGAQRRTTRAFELALTVLFQSGISHFGVCPDNLNDVPEAVVDYLRQIPASWDDVALIDGMPGEFAVLARRSGTRWFVAGINATPGKRTVTFTPTFLAQPMSGHVLQAGADQRTVEQAAMSLDPALPVSLTMRQNSGFVLVLDQPSALKPLP